MHESPATHTIPRSKNRESHSPIWPSRDNRLKSAILLSPLRLSSGFRYHQNDKAPDQPGLCASPRIAANNFACKADSLAVEAVIGEPCSTKWPDNKEFTGNFRFSDAPSDPNTFRKPCSDGVSLDC